MTMRSRRGAGTRCWRRRGREGRRRRTRAADAALADFAEELEAFSIGACVREGERWERV